MRRAHGWMQDSHPQHFLEAYHPGTSSGAGILPPREGLRERARNGRARQRRQRE
jgi:hypothetical protein